MGERKFRGTIHTLNSLSIVMQSEYDFNTNSAFFKQICEKLFGIYIKKPAVYKKMRISLYLR